MECFIFRCVLMPLPGPVVSPPHPQVALSMHNQHTLLSLGLMQNETGPQTVECV